MLNLSPSLLISRIITLIIALTVHEFAHAFVAYRFGDTTARDAGRLTLNPLKHLDVMGSLMLLVVGFGWAKPVPINPYALRRKSDSAVMWVSLAGPASNLLMAILAGLILRLGIFPWVASGGFLPSPAEFLFTFLSINLVLMLFNLIPLAPLDGEKYSPTCYRQAGQMPSLRFNNTVLSCCLCCYSSCQWWASTLSAGS